MQNIGHLLFDHTRYNKESSSIDLVMSSIILITEQARHFPPRAGTQFSNSLLIISIILSLHRNHDIVCSLVLFAYKKNSWLFVGTQAIGHFQFSFDSSKIFHLLIIFYCRPAQLTTDHCSSATAAA